MKKRRPHFWRYAGEEGDKAQDKWFTKLSEDKNYVILTAESETQKILGFVIGKSGDSVENSRFHMRNLICNK
jgi:hypothetical protein